jgi:SNF2 family DNA or RNA helicase
VFNDIGTGKTLSALWAADFLQGHDCMGKVLIVSTLSTLWRVWADELFKTLPNRSFAILHGSKQKRLDLLAEDHDYYIINHDGIKVLEAELVARKDITHIILDEGAQFRNKATDKWKSLNRLAGPIKPGIPEYQRTLWWMTGSPMPHSPTDIWAQCRIVAMHKVPKYFSRFRDSVMYQRDKFTWLPRTGWEDYVYSLLSDISVRFVRDDCLDLPPCVVEMRECEMSPTQKKLYREMKKELVLELADGTITAANEGIKRLKLLQIACGAIYTDKSDPYAIDVKPKLKILLEMIEEAGSKVLIFTPFKHSTKLLYKLLSKKFSVAMVTGDTGTSKRTEAFDQFQNGDLQIIVAHPQTMAHGLTLTASNTIIWWGPIDNYEFYEQAIGRITRPGQTRKQTIVQLVCSDIEKLVYKRLGTKEKMQGLLLELLREA